MSKELRGQTVDEYIKEYPNEFNRTLARKILQERSDLFENLEGVRSLIRNRKGALGDQHRKGKGLSKKGYPEILDVMQKYTLREQANIKTEDFVLPKSANKIGLISDLHIPYHDLEAIRVCFEYFKKEGINTLYINGDLVDFYQVSRWSKDPLRKTMAFEIEQVLEFFEFFREIFPKCKIYWKLGNHEERFEHYMQSRAKELIGVPNFSMEEIFELDKYKINLVGGRQKTKAGKLNIVHGHEFGQSIFSPVNPARGLFLRAKASIIAGHNHQTSEHNESDINENPTSCWSTGCLCDLRPVYRPMAYTKWNHGAARIEVHKDGTFNVDNFRIIDGKIR